MMPHFPQHPYTLQVWATYLFSLLLLAAAAGVAIAVVIVKAGPLLHALNGGLK